MSETQAIDSELSAPSQVPWRRIALMFAATRVLAIAWIVVSAHLFPESHFARAATMQHPHPMMNWDGGWYASIVEHGYSYTPGEQSSVAFFPLYPLSAAALASLGIPTHWSLMLVSNGCSLLAALALWKAVAERHGRGCADDSVVLFLCNPMTVFLMAGYSESTFLVVSILSLSAMRRSWPLAGIAGVMAALARPTGASLVLPMALEAIGLARREGGHPRRWRLLAASGPIVGLLLWCSFLYLRFDDPLAFIHVKSAWRHHFMPIWETFAGDLGSQRSFYYYWFLGFAIGTTAILAGGACLGLHWTWSIYAISNLLLFFQMGTPEATPRYEFGLFTVYPAAALILQRWPWTRAPLLALWIALAMVSLTLFTRGYWFT